MKRKAEENQINLFVCVKKQLRSKLPQRRRRFRISPALPSLSAACDYNSSCLAAEAISGECDSSRALAIKRRFEDSVGDSEFRRTALRRKEENREFADAGEVSETSCVDSCSGAVSGRRNENSPRFCRGEVAEDSETANKSEISAVFSFSGAISRVGGQGEAATENSLEINSNEVVSEYSALHSASESKFGKTSEKPVRKSEKRDEEGERESVVESRRENVLVDFDFTCHENFTKEVVCEPYDDLSACSELQSELFGGSSEFDFSDYTPSIWYESGSQFSERSINDESPSPTFQLFVQFSQEFCKSSFGLDSDSGGSALIDSQEITLLGLEEKEDEESYRMTRRRERRQIYFHDYAEEYCYTTNYGDLIVQQRLQMVHWIVEQSTKKELQKETLFLSVNLLDRFLSKGYFKSKRNLQIAGIACLTLATRIEENQPYNSVRQKIFQIGSNSYSRCEVVAMEWLVQEVLKFKSCLPSLYNFLWFYLKAAKASEKVEKTVKYLAVLALLGHEQLCYWPSTVAAGLVILASIAAKQEASCYNIQQTHARMEDDHLPECLKKLSWLLNYIS